MDKTIGEILARKTSFQAGNKEGASGKNRYEVLFCQTLNSSHSSLGTLIICTCINKKYAQENLSASFCFRSEQDNLCADDPKSLYLYKL
jgi:hypothetical protein